MSEVPSPTGDLSRLIETERRSEAVLAQARREAEETVRRARDAAESEDGATAREIELAAQELRRRLEEDRIREEQAIHAAARRVEQHYDDVPETSIDRLAAEVLRRLIAGNALHGQTSR